MNEVVVILPAYNEQENLETLTQNWQQYKDILQDTYKLYLKILVINDGSSDQTSIIAKRLEEQYSNFKVVSHDANKGLGEAVKTGLSYVVNNYPQCVFTCLMDCDNTHDPKYVLDMLACQKRTNVDVVIASRYQLSSKVIGLSAIRQLTSNGACFLYSTLLKVKNVKDYTCGYRLYKIPMLKKAYKKFPTTLIEETGFTCMAELLYKLSLCKATFVEIPFELRYDLKKGVSKMKVLNTIFQSFSLVSRLRKLEKPRRK